MPVPDDVIFGASLTYKMVRDEKDDDKRVQLLKTRLDSYFLNQVNSIAQNKEDRSPFPLSLLTCIGIETLGLVMYGNGQSSIKDVRKEAFLKIAGEMSSDFSKPLKKEEKELIAELWKKKDARKEKKKYTTLGNILFKQLRHTLVHGYQGRGVNLGEDLKDFSLSKYGTLHINPYWFWNRFYEVYENMFKKLHENKEPTNPLKKSALLYLDELIN